MQMSVSEICCKKFFVFKSRLRRKRLKKNAFKYRYNSALIRFLIFPPVGQIFPPVGKKLLVVGKLLSYVKVLKESRLKSQPSLVVGLKAYP
ncbi:hypothetical protein DYR87_09485 [Campylobacter jejuni]|nr:hypothetical protein [Campylobacter jejuni]ECY0963685.1 hypothetical protein [Campylobacter jejuni]